MFTIKFLKIPRKSKEFLEPNKTYSLGDASRLYFEATSAHPELTNKKIKLEVNDADQPYTIDTSIHVSASLADLIVEKISMSLTKSDDTKVNEQLISLKERIMAAFKEETKPASFTGVIPIAPEIEKVAALEDPIQVEVECIADAVVAEPDHANHATADIIISALDEHIDLEQPEINTDVGKTSPSFDISDILASNEYGAEDSLEGMSLADIFEFDEDPGGMTEAPSAFPIENENEEEVIPDDPIETLGISFPTKEEILNLNEFKVMKKLGALREDINQQIVNANRIMRPDLELLLIEIDEQIKNAQSLVYEHLEDKVIESVDDAYIRVEDYKQSIASDLDSEFNLKYQGLEIELNEAFEDEIQSLRTRHEQELEALLSDQEKRKSDFLGSHQKSLDTEYQRELSSLYKEQLSLIEHMTIKDIEEYRNDFDLKLFKEMSPEIDALLDQRTKIMNQLANLSSTYLVKNAHTEQNHADADSIRSMFFNQEQPIVNGVIYDS